MEENLEAELEKEFARLGIDPSQQKSLRDYLKLIRKRDEKTYQHSLRAALLGVKVAEFLKLEARPLLYAGLLHDIGKTMIEPEVLKKQSKFSQEDMEKMKAHPVYGYWLLRGIHDFSAQILLRHHRFGDQAYPQKLPESAVPYSKKTEKLIQDYARLLSLVDFYDAACFRTDSKYSDKKGLLEPTEVRQLLTEHHQDQKKLIDQLYQVGIFK